MALLPKGQLATGWQRLIGCLIFIGQFLHKSLIISGSFAKRDLLLRASYASSPPCTKCTTQNDNTPDFETDCNRLQHTATHSPAVCCDLLQSVLKMRIDITLRNFTREKWIRRVRFRGPRLRVLWAGVCVAVCCSVLWCVAVCYSLLQCVLLSGTSVNAMGRCVCCSELQRVAACCSVLQRVAICCSVL